MSPPAELDDDIFDTAVKAALDAGLIKGGDLVVLTAGAPAGIPGTTNFMRIDTVGEVLVRGQGVGEHSRTSRVRRRDPCYPIYRRRLFSGNRESRCNYH